MTGVKKDAKIFVTGHRGLAGSAIVRKLTGIGYTNVITRTHAELDLVDQAATRKFFDTERPEYVIHAAAKMGGMWAAMTESAEFIYQNTMMQNNVIDSAYRAGAKKLLLIGSTSIFPRDCPQPIKEEYLLTGPLEPTNISYAVAKIAGIVTVQSYNKQYGTDFITALATNLYGPGDNFDVTRTHVFAALIAKFYKAAKEREKEVVLWGTGNPRREFMYVDDFADACAFLLNKYTGSEIVNIGTGTDISIKELADKMRAVSGFAGNIVWDSSKPDGHPWKWLDVSKLHALGWRHSTDLDTGLKKTFDWYDKHHGNDN